MAAPKLPLATRIRDRRTTLGLSMETLAKHAALSPDAILTIEAGTREPLAWELVRLARALHLTLTELLTSDPLPPAPSVRWSPRR